MASGTKPIAIAHNSKNRVNMCKVHGCVAAPTTVHRLKETEGHEYPAEVAVCDRHAAQLRAGSEFRLSQDDELLVGDGIRQSGKVYLLGVESIRIESSVVTNVAAEEGPILSLRVRSAGDPAPHIIELEAGPAALDNLREWLAAMHY